MKRDFFSQILGTKLDCVIFFSQCFFSFFCLADLRQILRVFEGARVPICEGQARAIMGGIFRSGIGVSWLRKNIMSIC